MVIYILAEAFISSILSCHEIGSGCGNCAQRAFRHQLMGLVTLTSSLTRNLEKVVAEGVRHSPMLVIPLVRVEPQVAFEGGTAFCCPFLESSTLPASCHSAPSTQMEHVQGLITQPPESISGVFAFHHSQRNRKSIRARPKVLNKSFLLGLTCE